MGLSHLCCDYRGKKKMLLWAESTNETVSFMQILYNFICISFSFHFSFISDNIFSFFSICVNLIFYRGINTQQHLNFPVSAKNSHGDHAETEPTPKLF